METFRAPPFKEWKLFVIYLYVNNDHDIITLTQYCGHFLPTSRSSWVSSVGSRKSLLADQEEAVVKRVQLVEEEKEKQGSVSH